MGPPRLRITRRSGHRDAGAAGHDRRARVWTRVLSSLPGGPAPTASAPVAPAHAPLRRLHRSRCRHHARARTCSSPTRSSATRRSRRPGPLPAADGRSWGSSTASHGDHFGGVEGTTQAEVDAGRCAIIAPDGFMEARGRENIYAGPAMARRAGYMYGAALDAAERPGGSRPGPDDSTGHHLPHRATDTHHGDRPDPRDRRHRLEFQLTPGTGRRPR